MESRDGSEGSGHCDHCACPTDCICPCDPCIRAEGFESREAYESCMERHRRAVQRLFGKPGSEL